MKQILLISILLSAGLFTFACNPVTIRYDLPPIEPPVPTPTSTPCPGGGTFGSTGPSTGLQPAGGNDIFFNRQQALSNNTISSLAIDIQTTGLKFDMGIYADNGSGTGPTTRLAHTGIRTAHSTGIFTCAVTPVTITAGSYYWFAFIADGSGNVGWSYPLVNGSWLEITGHSLPTSALGSSNQSMIQFTLYGNTCP